MDPTSFKEEEVEVDFCVVGGGIAGMLAAISAARHGASVALMHDRPVLGGNASSEIRMWICGCRGKNLHETGIIEDLQLDNYFYNPDRNVSVWDSILYGAVKYEPGIRLFLNCSCNNAKMADGKIESVTGWQLTTQKWITIKAKIFADCSGDSVLAPITGADFRMGREAKAEFGESLERDWADSHTMGMSCLIQARECSTPQPYTPPPWAHKYLTHEEVTRDIEKFSSLENFWWLELGGMQNSISDTEDVRDELLRCALGLWDHFKNHGDHGAANWKLDWIGFLPGKRESRRYLGDCIMTQNDVVAGGKFDDIVAYGGWPLDDHDPRGFKTKSAPNVWIDVDTPYGIPLRSLYSRNVPNLMFAGRNISVTHAALSSTRVICTCGIIGQAVGTAAATAIRHGVLPREAAAKYTRDIQQDLMRDDCYIPWHKRDIPELTASAKMSSSSGRDPEVLRNGVDRPVGDESNSFDCELGGYVEVAFGSAKQVSEVRAIFDSNLTRYGQSKFNILSNFPLDREQLKMPGTLVKSFRIDVLENGAWWTAAHVTDNHRRMVLTKLDDVTAEAVRIIPESTWGEEKFAKMFAFDVK